MAYSSRKDRFGGPFFVGECILNRCKRKELRMTSMEYEEIEKRAKMARLGMSEYLRRAALGKEIIVMEGLPELARQLGKIGGNLNQAVMLFREHRIESIELEHLREEVKHIWQLLNFQTGKIK